MFTFARVRARVRARVSPLNFILEINLHSKESQTWEVQVKHPFVDIIIC